MNIFQKIGEASLDSRAKKWAKIAQLYSENAPMDEPSKSILYTNHSRSELISYDDYFPGWIPIFSFLKN